MSAATPQHETAPYYFVPAPSRFPVLVSVDMFFLILDAAQ